ncbi:hypothetical protein M8I34_14275 [Streptomyces sp. MCA2]|uniref:hypothetical protein n=1 Tax=Streptomyces TaxID=1883 RepID=UPI0020207123|nr:hypothetical protein [Streptomyces sp. MCA2]MCL7492592.1 hypothetical protein [Streptomyces sp. MCA2]
MCEQGKEDITELHDDYAQALNLLVDTLAAGGQAAPPIDPQPPVDLMAALEESVRDAQRARNGAATGLRRRRLSASEASANHGHHDAELVDPQKTGEADEHAEQHGCAGKQGHERPQGIAAQPFEQRGSAPSVTCTVQAGFAERAVA